MPVFGALANPNNPGDAHHLDDLTQVFVAGLQHRLNQRFGKVVGVMFCPRSPNNRSGQWFTTNSLAKVASGEPYISSMRFHSRVPETS